MITLFDPRNTNNYIRTYPELLAIDEFKVISSERLLRFVWYYSNPTSPIIELPTYLRVEQALESAYGDNSNINEKQYFSFMELNFPSSLISAMIRMEKFRVNERVRAYRLALNIKKNFLDNTKMFRNSFEYIEGSKRILSVLQNIQTYCDEKFGLNGNIDEYVLQTESYDNEYLSWINLTFEQYEDILIPEKFKDREGQLNFLQYIKSAELIIKNLKENISALECGLKLKTTGKTKEDKSLVAEYHRLKQI